MAPGNNRNANKAIAVSVRVVPLKLVVSQILNRIFRTNETVCIAFKLPPRAT